MSRNHYDVKEISEGVFAIHGPGLTKNELVFKDAIDAEKVVMNLHKVFTAGSKSKMQEIKLALEIV